MVDDDETEEEMTSPVMWRKPYTVVAAADAAKEPHDRSDPRTALPLLSICSPHCACTDGMCLMQSQ